MFDRGPQPRRWIDLDPDVDPPSPPGRNSGAPRRAVELAVIAVGGVAGALARWGVGVLLPHHADRWPWATLLINVSGCLLLGALMVVITEKVRPHPLARPLLGVGVLGGYTTFSTYVVEAVQAAGAGRAWLGLGYLVATPVLAVLAVGTGMALARVLTRSPGRPA